MKDLIAYCGIDCEKCDAFIATVTNDQALREKTAKMWSKLNDTLIRPEQLECFGCRRDGVKTVFCADLCEIRRCATGRGVSTCGECQDMEECETVAMVTGNNPEARRNLRDCSTRQH